MSRRAHAQAATATREDGVIDFAFADTVVAADLDEPMPPSGIVVSDETGHAHCMMPVTYPHQAQYQGQGQHEYDEQHQHQHSSAPPPHYSHRRQRQTDLGLKNQLRGAWDEMNELWDATASNQHPGAIVRYEDPFVRAAAVGRRVKTMFSFFEWDRADLLRAAWIGLAVFVLAATVGAIALS